MAHTTEIFCWYAAEDRDFLTTLEKRLAELKRQGLATVWSDIHISPGTNQEEEIAKHLNTAQIILLLVSPDFIVSDYCYSKMLQVMERHKRGEARVIPIIVRICSWQEMPFGKLKPLPGDAKPVNSWPDPDAALLDVIKGLRIVLEEVARQSTAIPHEEEQQASNSKYKPAHDSLFSQAIECLCPYCIQKFYPGDCRIMSRLHPGKVLQPAPVEWVDRQRARNAPEPLISSKYRRELASRECPHCGRLLPYNIELAENISIAIIGDTSAGKSFYFASLVHEMKETWIKENSKHIELICLTPEAEKWFRIAYLDPLFVYEEVLNANRPGRFDAQGNPLSGEPLIYELIFKKLPDHPAKRINLILYDNAGEDFVREMSMIQFAPYVLCADAIIFVFDPNSIEEIRNENHLMYYPSGRNEPYDLINDTAHLIRRYHASGGNHRLSTMPTAVMMSKSDLLEKVKPEYSTLFSQPAYKNYANLYDLKAIDEDVRAIIEEFGEHFVIRAATIQFPNVKFFATSATGCPCDADGVFPSVEPCRVLDPLLWILYSLGVIKGQDV